MFKVNKKDTRTTPMGWSIFLNYIFEQAFPCYLLEYITQLATTCSKLTTEAVEQGVKYVQS